MSRPTVALAHDYLTQRGGAERVALTMAHAFPGAPLHTTLFDPLRTFPGFDSIDVRASRLNRYRPLRAWHRLAMPLLAGAVDSMQVEADVLFASSSGWAHGIRTSGRKIVYCHAPARWLYQRERYLGEGKQRRLRERMRGAPAAAALSALAPRLRAWDHEAAATADRYLANSTVTRDAIREAYGIEADIVAPPPALVPGGPEESLPGVEPGFVLCVARLLPYKNVDRVIDAVRLVPGTRLAIVGDGPELSALRAQLGAADRATRGAVQLLGRVADPQLRWLYRNSSMLVAASYEDYGLSPLEAAAFGKPSVVLRAGGYLDTVIDGRTGTFFDAPEAEPIAAALASAADTSWDAAVLRAHAAEFSVERFEARLHEIVASERALV